MNQQVINRTDNTPTTWRPLMERASNAVVSAGIIFLGPQISDVSEAKVARADGDEMVIHSFNCEYDRIAITPGICGGAARVRGTRVEVWFLEGLRRINVPDGELLAEYPFLTADDLRSAWKYVSHHQAEIDSLIAANR